MTTHEATTPGIAALTHSCLDFDETARTQAAQDFGRTVTARPAAVLRPRCAADVVAAIALARERGWRVAARGAGHSVGGQALAPDGLVIDMVEHAQILGFAGDLSWVDVAPGIRWHTLLAETVARGRRPPVLTDWLDLSVGGTLSVGGLGGESFRDGAQTDHVLELDVVTGEGMLVTCSPTREPELFDAIRAGLGQFGIMTRARLRLIPAPAMVTLHLPLYIDPTRFVEDAHRFTRDPRISAVRAHVLANDPAVLRRYFGDDRFASGEARAALDRAGPWLPVLELSEYHDASAQAAPPNHALDPVNPLGSVRALSRTQTLSFLEFASRVPPIIARERTLGPASHPEVVLFVPASETPGFLAWLLGSTSHQELSGALLVVPLVRSAIATPGLRLPDSERFCMIVLLRTAVPDTPENVEYLTARNVQVAEQGLRAGGVRYPCDSLVGLNSPTGWQRHFGDTWARMAAAKQRYDPEHCFAPGLRVFEKANPWKRPI